MVFGEILLTGIISCSLVSRGQSIHDTVHYFPLTTQTCSDILNELLVPVILSREKQSNTPAFFFLVSENYSDKIKVSTISKASSVPALSIFRDCLSLWPCY